MLCKSLRITKIMLRKYLITPRTLVLLLVMSAFLYNMTFGIPAFCSAAQVRINPLIYPLINSYSPLHIILMAGIIFLFSNAPFFDEQQPFLLARSGRKAWLLACVFYIAVASALYFAVVMLLPALFVSPVATLSTDGWGSAIQTLQKTNAAEQFGILAPLGGDETAKILVAYTPWSSFGISFLLQWLIGIFLGLLIFAINLIGKKKAGAFVAALLTVVDIVVLNTMSEVVFKFSPVSFGRLCVVDITGMAANLPSLTWALGFLVIAIGVLIGLVMFQSKNQSIDFSQSMAE